VRQAVHWLDHEAFNLEIQRLTKKGGVVAIWGKGLSRIDPNVDKLIDYF